MAVVIDSYVPSPDAYAVPDRYPGDVPFVVPMFVYWPAGFRPPVLDGLPLIPNVGRMRLIR